MKISYRTFTDPSGNQKISHINFPYFPNKHYYDHHHKNIYSSAHSHEYKIRKTDVHIRRKRFIIKNAWGLPDEMLDEYKQLTQCHRLSKGKVHCSCSMCQCKKRNRGWKHSDKVKLEKGWEMSEEMG